MSIEAVKAGERPAELSAEAIREMVEKATAMGAFRAVREAAPDIAAQALRWHDELTAARARIAALEACAEFARWALREGPFDGNSLDGGSVQDKALELGLIRETKFDPAIHGESAEFEAGDRYYVMAVDAGGGGG